MLFSSVLYIVLEKKTRIFKFEHPRIGDRFKVMNYFLRLDTITVERGGIVIFFPAVSSLMNFSSNSFEVLVAP